MKNLIFDLQKFNEVTISSGETLTIDGIIFTALNGDAKLNLESEKVQGISSGKVQATLSDSENSPIITFDSSDGKINFTATGNGENITVTRIFLKAVFLCCNFFISLMRCLYGKFYFRLTKI